MQLVVTRIEGLGGMPDGNRYRYRRVRDLVDPLSMNVYLRPLVGDSAEKAAELWRTKQLEYTFRRAGMDKYENFDICTRQALVFVLASLGINLSADDRQTLIAKYQHLHPYSDAVPDYESCRTPVTRQ